MRSWQVLERLILGPGARNGLSVLIFHRVRRERDLLRPNEPTAEEFETMIRFVAGNFRVRSLYEGVAELTLSSRPFHAVAVTFDDGYADNLEVALPILAKYGVPATFFIASGLLDGGLMWNDRLIEAVRGTRASELDLRRLGLGALDVSNLDTRRQSLRELIKALKYRSADERTEISKEIQELAHIAPRTDLMMTTAQVRELAAHPFAELGGHTLTHPILTQLTESDAEREIVDGKERLESITGERIRCFAYPNGVPGRDFASAHVSLVKKAGFELAVTTSAGGIKPDTDRYQLPRFTPWDREGWKFGLRMLSVARSYGVTAA